MSIRRARAADFWRTTLSRKFENRYEKLTYEDLCCLGTGELQFCGGISAIVGGNGVGKSTLAAALGEILQTTIAQRYVGDRTRLGGSKLRGFVRETNAERTRYASGSAERREIGGDSITTESWWLDPAYWGFHTRRQVASDPNFADVIEPVKPLELNQEQLDRLCYVVGKKYDSCLIFEISDYAGFDRFPYFKVTSNGVKYGSEGMGQGELSLMLVLWVLQDLPKNSILILEEPESHVSPRSQAALMNVIAEAAALRGIWTIITTHSPTIAEPIPAEHLRLVARTASGVEIIHKAKRHLIASVLGSGQSYNGMALVEDDVAKEFLISILDEFDPDLLRQLEVVSAGGESKISAALPALPQSSQFRLLGVYDGDQRGRINGEDFNWPHVFLPGTQDPAAMLKESMQIDGATSLLITELRRDPDSIVAALDAHLGTEPRDWIIECAKAMVITKGELVRCLFRVWLQSPGATQMAREFVDSLTKGYDELSRAE